jgi:hypothetical protein
MWHMPNKGYWRSLNNVYFTQKRKLFMDQQKGELKKYLQTCSPYCIPDIVHMDELF